MNTARIGPDPASANLATYLQQIREQERGELARELHDELGSLLTGAKLELATLKLRLSDTSVDVGQCLSQLGKIINSGISFSRRVVEGLHPSSLANLGLTASLEILAGEFRRSTGIATATDFEEVALDEAAQLTAYRMVQESLNNTSKYAQATNARIVILDCGSNVMVTVCDNGTGFDTAAAAQASYGLAGMRHRVGACGGQMTVSSTPGRGTMLVAVLPKRVGGASLRAPAMRPVIAHASRQRRRASARRVAMARRRACAATATGAGAARW